MKNKISGKIVDKSEGMPSVTPMKKKLSHAPESKKFVSNSKMTHSNKAKVVKEEIIEEGKSPEEIRKSWQPGIEAFKKIREKYLLYGDFQ